jgi:hypothetical protein
VPKRSSQQKAIKPTTNQKRIPEKQPAPVEKLRGCKSTLIGIANQISPEAPLQYIDAKLVQSFINKLSGVLKEVKSMPDGTKYLKPKEGVYENVRLAKVRLTVALDARRDLERNGFNRKVSADFYESLNECYEYILKALPLFSV